MANNLEITTKIGCSNACTCCNQAMLAAAYYKQRSPFETQPTLMSLETFKGILVNIPPSVDITFSGFCEPYLNPQTTTMMRLSKSRGHRLHLYSTLVGASSDDISAIADIKPDTIVIHRPDDTYFKYQLQTWEKGYRLFQQLRIEHKVHTLSAQNVHSRAGTAFASNIYIRGKIACKTGGMRKLNNNVVLPNGCVQTCCMDYFLRHSLGNLLTQTWDEIHSGDKYKEIIRLMDEEDNQLLCRKCVNCVNI
jgi:hypothetical protein